ncbi:hypothetical protein DV736_g5195, partial [Chaetothyriales sp. CBS 134916]
MAASKLTIANPKHPKLSISRGQAKQNHPRKRSFSHKVRSGCDTCKSRHLKCDETRPTCSRCRKASLNCNYNVPRTWTFDSKKALLSTSNLPVTEETAVVRKEPDVTQAEDVCATIYTSWGTREECRGIDYWVRETARFLGHFAGSRARQTWEVIIPRCALHLPAVKQLIVAVAMIDERLCNHSLQNLEVQHQRLLYHYNLAISILVSGKTTPLEVILSSMVAWVLETMNDHPAKAMMHLDACSRLLRQALKDSPRGTTSETQDIIYQHLTVAHQQCVGYASYAQIELRQVHTSNDDSNNSGKGSADDGLLPPLVSQIMPPSIPTPQDIKAVINEYYNRLSLASSDPTIDVAQTLRYRRSCEIVLMRYRQITNVPYANIIAMHYYLNLANILIPSVDAEVMNHSSLGGMDYILDRLEESYRTPGLAKDYKRDLEETLELIFTKVLLLAKEERHLTKAKSLLGMVQRAGARGFT